jgi:pimeloyl-ACP methyl ester carboxylesterase
MLKISLHNISVFTVWTMLIGINNVNAIAQNIEPTRINLEGYYYPFVVRYDTIRSQQQPLAMAYMYENINNPKATMMLLHGKNFCGAYWGEVMKNLVSQGYNVLVPDQIGFGKSSKPEHYQYSFQQLVENTKHIVDALKIKKLIILGHSMGGMLATRFALMYPDRVEQLILEDPIGLEDWKKWVPYKDVDFNYQKELKRTDESVKQYMLANYFHNEWKSSYDELVYLQTAFIHKPDYPLYAMNAALTSDMIFTQPVVYEFENLKVPTTLIIGQLDKTAIGKDLVGKQTASKMGNYPQLGKEIAQKIPNCQLIELQNVGHVPHIENFSLFFGTLMKVLKK